MHDFISVSTWPSSSSILKKCTFCLNKKKNWLSRKREGGRERKGGGTEGGREGGEREGEGGRSAYFIVLRPTRKCGKKKNRILNTCCFCLFFRKNINLFWRENIFFLRETNLLHPTYKCSNCNIVKQIVSFSACIGPVLAQICSDICCQIMCELWITMWLSCSLHNVLHLPSMGRHG